jgi:hypothetical protein
MNFKFLSGEEENDYGVIRFVNTINFEPTNVEFCFQFGDNDPVVFATGPNECHIRLNPTHDGNMAFNDANGNVFKLFARQRENG